MKKSNIPVLRFPAFKDSGEWEEKALGEMCTRIGDGIHTTPMYAEKSSIYFINGNNLRNGKIIFQDSTKFVDEHDAKKHKRNLSQRTILMSINGTIGNLAYYKNENIILGKSACYINLDEYNNIDFIYHCLNSLRVQAFYNSEFTGSTISNLSLATIKLTPIATPSPPEQQKIADCLSSLDASIDAHTKKFDLLKEYKKGLLQKLFPQEGQKIPEYRFPEFKDCGEWDFLNGNKLFVPITDKKHNSDLPILAITQEFGAVPRDIINYRVSATKKSIQGYKVVQEGDFIISLRSFQGGIEYSHYKGLCTSAYIVLRKKIQLCDMFFKYYFKTKQYIIALNRHLEGIRDGKMVSYQQFSEIYLPFPSPLEQQKIADCLSTLDKKIEAQTEKIQSLKEHKKGLMQNLFPINNVS